MDEESLIPNHNGNSVSVEKSNNEAASIEENVCCDVMN